MTDYQSLAIVSALLANSAATLDQSVTTGVMGALALIAGAIGAWRR